MNKYTLLLLLTYFNLFSNARNVSKSPTEQIQNLVKNYGYPFEVHNVESEDSYTLELHRIPHGLQDNGMNKKKDVVYLKAGLADSSAAFLISGPSLSLAYILADKGYDVWLGNHRGNSFCRKNKFYSETNPKFWNFSWHEIGLYDNTVMIDYILNTTKQEKLFHVCHSQGCTEFYVMTSLKPEYNNKIVLSVNLAPAIFFGHTSLFAKTALTSVYLFKNIFAHTGYIKILDQDLIFRIMTRVFCKNKTYLRGICYIVMYVIQGYDWTDTDPDLFATYLDYYPAGASSKQLLHYAMSQFSKGSFRQFDYGRTQNLKLYNSPIPPEYPLDKTTVPIVLYYGDSDNMVSQKDSETLAGHVPNLVKKKVLRRYNHGGYFLHRNARVLVYNEVVQLFQEKKINV